MKYDCYILFKGEMIMLNYTERGRVRPYAYIDICKVYTYIWSQYIGNKYECVCVSVRAVWIFLIHFNLLLSNAAVSLNDVLWIHRIPHKFLVIFQKKMLAIFAMPIYTAIWRKLYCLFVYVQKCRVKSMTKHLLLKTFRNHKKNKTYTKIFQRIEMF